MAQDLHNALKVERKGEFESEGVSFQFVRLQDGKDRIRFSLHANPNRWSTAGYQTTDHLANLGFRRGKCTFTGGECYSAQADESLDVDAFATAFSASFREYVAAEAHLAACGIYLDRPEGPGYFYGKSSSNWSNRGDLLSGDGHTSSGTTLLKSHSDQWFEFRLSWLGEPTKGWVTHYTPKHPPLTPEMSAAFKSLGMRTYPECPEFDFGPCSWRFSRFEADGESRFGLNNHSIHSHFDAHAQHFGPGVEALMKAQQFAKSAGFVLYLEYSYPTILPQVSVQHIDPTVGNADNAEPFRTSTKPSPYRYDVALSFAGTNRHQAEILAKILREADVKVFYDEFYQEQLWGKDLPVYFADIYEKESRFCVIFVSAEYVERMWTQHERQHAVARAMKNLGEEYILQIRMDHTALPGVSPTQGYVSIDAYSIPDIGDMLLKKLAALSIE